MAKKKLQPQKGSTGFFNLNLSESYISLFLGALVVIVATFLVFTFSRNGFQGQRIYDRINTSVSTFRAPISAQPNPVKETPKSYEVKAGESLWSISEKIYGSGYNWVDLAKANKLNNPSLITAGLKLVIPDVQKIVVQNNSEQMQNSIPSISGGSYKIAQGDYLWNIAIRRYGDGYKWPEIARANNIPNPDLIYAGDTLKLP